MRLVTAFGASGRTLAHSWRNIAVTLNEQRSKREMACFRQLYNGSWPASHLLSALPMRCNGVGEEGATQNLFRICQFTIKNKTMSGDSQKRMAAMIVSHPPCSSTANSGRFFETGEGVVSTVEISRFHSAIGPEGVLSLHAISTITIMPDVKRVITVADGELCAGTR